MKKLFFLIPLAVLLISATYLYANAQEEPSESFCNEVNHTREFCKRAKVNCEMTLQKASDELIEKIQSCPLVNVTDLPPKTTERKHPEIGSIPCCTYRLSK